MVHSPRLDLIVKSRNLRGDVDSTLTINKKVYRGRNSRKSHSEVKWVELASPPFCARILSERVRLLCCSVLNPDGGPNSILFLLDFVRRCSARALPDLNPADVSIYVILFSVFFRNFISWFRLYPFKQGGTRPHEL
jgi:hypothetical protein